MVNVFEIDMSLPDPRQIIRDLIIVVGKAYGTDKEPETAQEISYMISDRLRAAGDDLRANFV